MQRHLWTCVLAGGDGRRLEAMVERHYGDGRPKQFCHWQSPHTMLEQALERASYLSPARRTLVSLCVHHLPWWDELDVDPDLHLSVQPRNAGTGPGVLLAALSMATMMPDSIAVFLPSDHVYSDELRLAAHIREATQWIASNPERVVLLGAEPDYPETEYGWLQPTTPHKKKDGPPPASFVEKPDLCKAINLMESGALWNTMITICRSEFLLKLFSQHHPEWVTALRLGLRGDPKTLQEIYDELPNFDFSRDLMERCCESIHMWPMRGVVWSDLGNEARVERYLNPPPPPTSQSQRPLRTAPLRQQEFRF